MKLWNMHLILGAAIVLAAGGPAFAQDIPTDHAEVDDLPVSVSIDVILDEDDVDGTITITNSMADESAEHPVIVDIPNLHADDHPDGDDNHDDEFDDDEFDSDEFHGDEFHGDGYDGDYHPDDDLDESLYLDEHASENASSGDIPDNPAGPDVPGADDLP